MRRRGFNIIELLVVIGILALLMGLTLGGIGGLRKTDRLLVTEHLVGDVIRQAKHTARTSGTPVLVSIRNQDGHGWVSGISRIPIWNESYDHLAIGDDGVVAGLVKHGFQTSSLATSAHTLTRGTKIVRGGRTDGFYLTCHVRPPLVGSAGMEIPLLLIGPNSLESSSLCGIKLRRAERKEQDLQSDFTPTPPISHQPTIETYPTAMPTLTTWEIIGWVNTGEPDPTEVSSIDPNDKPAGLNRDELPLHDSVSNLDVAWPMAGGRWEEVGLLFDEQGQRLVLYRNGVRVGEKTLTNATLADGDETIYVGQFDQGGGNVYSGGAILDEVAVHRLAAAEPKRLPGDVIPDQNYSITAHPDGRVEVHVVTAAVTGPINFSGSFNQAAKASITVSIHGRVHGRITP